MTTPITKWAYPLSNPDQREAVWHYGVKDPVATATLTTATGETYTVGIFCDGLTRYRIPYKNQDGSWDFDNPQIIRYADEWEAIGVTTDTEMQALIDELAQHDYEAHIYNSWYDCYALLDGEWQHLDAVTHTTDDAQAQAEAILQEMAAHGGTWLDYFSYLDQK